MNETVFQTAVSNVSEAINNPQSVLNALAHPVLLLDENSKFTYANTATEIFMQTSLPVLMRQKLTDIIAFDSPLVALVDQVRRTGSSMNEYGIDVGLPMIQQEHLIDVFASPLPENADHILVMLQQRTVAQMIERQLTHRAAARSVSGLASVLAHEIKNPLSGIKGAAQLIESILPPEERNLTNLICEETDRICRLVDRMEVFGDERPLLVEPVNIHEVLGHVKQVAETGFGSNVEFIEYYDPSLPPIPGNRDKLVQVFLNLLKNACEAIGQNQNDGKITLYTAFRPGVRLSVPGSQSRVSLPLEIVIEDNGPGIPEALLPHLFDPFVTTKQSGSGLGLALVAKIVGDHGGIIECDSQPRSTIFRVLMPMHDSKTGLE